MKNLLEGFKQEVGKLLISFGEKLTGELEKTNLRVDKLEKEIEVLKEKFNSETTAIPEQKSTEKFEIETTDEFAIQHIPATEIKKSKSKKSEYSLKDNLDLFNKIVLKKGRNANTFLSENGYITCNNSDINIQIKSDIAEAGTFRTDIKTSLVNSNIEVDDFRKLVFKTSDAYSTINLNAKDMEKVFAAKNYASTDKINPKIAGVYFENVNGELNISATDAFRMYNDKIKSSVDFKAFLLPSAILNAIEVDYNKLKSEVVIKRYENKVEVIYKDRIITAALNDLPFPDYKNILEREMYSKKIEFNKELDFKVLNELSSKDIMKKNVIALDLRYRVIRALDKEFELDINIIDSRNYKLNKDDCVIGINSKYLQEALKISNTIEYNNATSMLKLTKDTTTVVVMPSVLRG